MSDCSTKAFCVPSTCGNCGHSCEHRTKLYGCAYDYVPCMLNGTFEHALNRCSEWSPRKTDKQEQRRKQLEKLALDMLTYIGIISMVLNESSLKEHALKNAAIFNEFDEALQELGVGTNADD